MIDTSKWGEFRIGDLFEVSRPKARSQASYEDGEVPFVASGNYNNGIVRMCKPKENEELDKKGCISVSPLDGSAFYQPVDFLGRGGAGSAIILLRNDNITELNGLYISAVIRDALTKFSYNNQLNSKSIQEEFIKLPATDSGEPDWGYMESYMKATMEDAKKSLDSLNKVDDTKHLVDVSGWGEFPITSLFNLSLPKGDLQVKQVEDGDKLLITPSAYNNGLLKRISSESISTLYDANALTVDMFGNAYYHEEKFFVTAHGHVNVLEPKKPLNLYVGMFLATAIRAMFLGKYGFNEMCTLKILKAEKIMLPIDKNGEPNWQYMEEFMKKINSDASKDLSVLAKVLQPTM